MKLDDYIENLVANVTPVSSRRSDWFIATVWLAAGSLASSAIIFAVHFGWNAMPRVDLSFALECAALAFVGGAAAFGALFLSIPGAAHLRIFSSLVLLGIVAWLFSFSLPGWGAGLPRFSLELGAEYACPRDIALSTLAGTSILFLLIRKRAPVMLFATGSLAALAGATVGALALKFFCFNNDFWHVAVCHGGPIAMLTMVGGLVGQRVLRW